MDRPLAELFPPLVEVQADSIELLSCPSARLRNVLMRWRGIEWAPYLDATPNELLARRNAGRKCLTEFIAIAEHVASARAGRKQSDRPPPTSATSESLANGGMPVSAVHESSDAISAALQVVVAWGTFERGGGSLERILDRAFGEEILPGEVAAAVETLRAADLRVWARPLVERFDPWRGLRQFLESLNPEDRDLLDRRLLSLTGASTLEQLGVRRNVTRERIRQIESRLAKRLGSLSARPDHHPFGRSVLRVREGIGLAMQVGHLETTPALVELVVNSITLERLDARALLWLSGPYQLAGDWLIRRPAQHVIDQSRDLLRQLTSSGSISVAEAEDALEAFGVARSEARDWIVSVGEFRLHDDVLVRWGGSMADKAEVVLRLAGAPLSRDELAARLGPGTKWRSMVNQLYGDPRFKRTGIRHFGLAEWEHDEYTGVADEIAQEIDRRGGEASLDHLVAFVSSTYGVSPTSVRAYALGPQFERSPSGSIRLRAESRPAERRAAPEATRGAFIVQGAWSYRIRVSDQHLRGSGSVLPASIAHLFGLEPLGAVDLASRWGQIRLTWPSRSPHLSSIRAPLEGFHADEGDLVFLVVRDATADLIHVPRSHLDRLQGLDRLAAEVGGDPQEGEPIQIAARALALDPDSGGTAVARRLLARGEDELASLIPQEDGDQPLVLTLGSARFVEVRMSR